MFKFNLEAKVKDRTTGIVGTVIGRVEYLYNDNFYLMRWKDEKGSANEEWLNEKQIEEVEE